MAKLTVLAALFLALLAFNEASTITTTVTTTTIDDKESTGKPQQCQKQVQGRQFRYCQKLMMQKTEKVFLNMVTRSNTNEKEETQQCCQQLQSINSKCVCDAVREMMMRMKQKQPGGSQQGEQMEMMMMMKAANLPVMCGIRQQPCSMF